MKKKKAQDGIKVDTTGVRTRAKSIGSVLDSAIMRKKAQGVREWTPAERAAYQKKSKSFGAPPPGWKPKKKK